MGNAYQNQDGVQDYLGFLNSPNGQVFQNVLLAAFKNRLGPAATTAQILDAGCGSGWLTAALSRDYPKIEGCDASASLIKYAARHHPGLKFQIVDLAHSLPYVTNAFDVVILSMVIHDLDEQPAAFANLKRVLKPGGKLLTTMVNPYYAYPIGVWKRGWCRFLLRKFPRLKIVQPYNHMPSSVSQNFSWRTGLTSQFYPLSKHLNNFLAAGFRLSYFADLKTEHDSPVFNLQYQLYRFPIILLLELKK